MREFVITADSNSDLPASFIQEHNMTIVPQYYAFGDTVYGDELNMTPDEFYQKMREGELPTSMANNPEVIRARFEPLLKEGLDILHIAFSSALSGSYNNVMMVVRELLEEYPEASITVIDSLSVSLGESLLVFRAFELKEAGKSKDEIADILNEEKLYYNIQFTVDDLHHLQRGGRVSKATAIIGSMISVKPLLYVTPEGNLVPGGTVRGRKKSLNTLLQKMSETVPENVDKNRPVAIAHANCLEDAKYIEKVLKEKMGYTNIVINDVSPSIGVHAGPGAIGLLYFGNKRK
ncbi:DegV family protein [Anaerolentibacter hominis]|uniref:DegV family protein n=1 Tax=Anaerolentibacter hominis TaxID=3079009 RepID=UPI0031B8A43D